MDWVEAREWIELVAKVLGIAGGLIGLWKFVIDRRKETRETIARDAAQQKADDEKARQRAEADERLRVDALRLNEVTAWGHRCLEVFGTAMTVLNPAVPVEPDDAKRQILACYTESSVLIEKGRIYFQNVPDRHHGAEKEPAYRGLRPRILDFLVALNQFCLWKMTGKAVSDDELFRSTLKAEREFLSLLQKEVGRTASHAPEAARSGAGEIADRILAQVQQTAR